jgi:thiol-disulfide isomerase/thioredoxin
MAFAAASIAALSLIGCGQANADKAFGEKVHAYLIEHPEVLVEMSAKLQEKQTAEKTKNARSAMNKYRQALERDPRDFVANPNGSITVVEFFDYRCGYCKLAAPQIVELIQKNPDVRFVFKDFVIFGHDSEVAARMVLGAKDQGKTIELHKRLMAEKSLDEAGVMRIAQEPRHRHGQGSRVRGVRGRHPAPGRHPRPGRGLGHRRHAGLLRRRPDDPWRRHARPEPGHRPGAGRQGQEGLVSLRGGENPAALVEAARLTLP